MLIVYDKYKVSKGKHVVSAKGIDINLDDAKIIALDRERILLGNIIISLGADEIKYVFEDVKRFKGIPK